MDNINNNVINLSSLSEDLLNSKVIDLVNQVKNKAVKNIKKKQKKVIPTYSIFKCKTDDRIYIGLTSLYDNHDEINGYCITQKDIFNTHSNKTQYKEKRIYVLIDKENFHKINISKEEYEIYINILLKIEEEQEKLRILIKQIYKKYCDEPTLKIQSIKDEIRQETFLTLNIKNLPEEYYNLTWKEVKERRLKDYYIKLQKRIEYINLLHSKVNRIFIDSDFNLSKLEEITEKNDIHMSKLIWNNFYNGFYFYDTYETFQTLKELKPEDEYIYYELLIIISNIRTLYNQINQKYFAK